jgi:hypothetical protein
MLLGLPKRFWAPKAGNVPEEYEDASNLASSLAARSLSADRALMAICDGASEAAFSREWANILTDAFVSRPLDLENLDGPVLTNWLGPCESEWNEAVPWERIPWHGEAKTRAGSLAALLGLTVELTPDRSGEFPWRAVAIGDCCLFVVRGGGLETSFPLDESGLFNSMPSLICSNPDNNGDLWEQVRQISGEFQQGDLILLASDAVASWLLQQCESGDKPWETLLRLEESEWEGWVQERRQERSMRNDDSTLIVVEVETGRETGNAEQTNSREH